MRKLLHLGQQEHDPDRYVPLVLPWLLDASGYTQWLLGDRERTRVVLAAWLRRASSEVALQRTTLLLDDDDDDEAIGGYIALGGEVVEECRRADLAALAAALSREERRNLMQRMRLARGLFAPVKPDQLYLSRIGVTPRRRGLGHGRVLLSAHIRTGVDAGWWRFRLDVAEGNRPAIRLYESAGFRVTDRAEANEAGIGNLVMELDLSADLDV